MTAMAQQKPAIPQISNEARYHLRAINSEVVLIQQRYTNLMAEKASVIEEIKKEFPNYTFVEHPNGDGGGDLIEIPPPPPVKK